VQHLGPADVEEVLGLHRDLDDRDRFLRFSVVHPADLEAFVRRSLAPDSGAVSLGVRVRGRLVGVVQLFPVGEDGGAVAAVGARGWRSHGVATVLLEHLAEVALRGGVHRLVADVLAENWRMLRVLADLGMPLSRTWQGSSVRLEIGLEARERYADAVEDRHRKAAAAGLRPVLTPRSVALIGVGRREGSVGRAVLRSLRAARYDGTVTLVHPAAAEIDGLRCLPSAAALPPGVDLAVVTVPASAVEEVVGDCGRVGVRAVLLITSGIGSVPGLAERVRDAADRSGIRLVGPNTFGVVGPGTGSRLDTTFTGEVPLPGDVGLVAQSGGIAIAVVAAWQRLGLGLSAMVAIGDALDVGARDVLAWFDEDPGTTLVVLYAESETDLRGLVPTARHLAARVPLLALDVGTSTAGQRAAASHTARSATPRALREAAYTAAGIQSVPDLTVLAAAAGLLRGQPPPGTGTVAVLTNVGGGGVLAADACVAAGLPVDPLAPDLQDALREVLPALASVGNPVDTSAAVGRADFGAALACLLRSSDVGAVVTVTAPTGVSDPGPAVAETVGAEAMAGGTTPVIDVRLTGATSVRRVDLPAGTAGRFLVSVDDPAVAAGALGVAARRARWLSRPRALATAPDGVDVRAARGVVRGVLSRAPEGSWLRVPEVAALCAAAGLAQVGAAWVTTPEEGVLAAVELSGPVAVKGFVEGVVHKGDAGLLRLPVTDPAEVRRVIGQWRDRAADGWVGAVVQHVVEPGDELLVGALRDASAGSVVVLGAGGRATDALGHRVHGLAPVAIDEADDMITRTGLFDTAHGRRLHRAGVADCLRRVGWLADVLPELAELDVNPLVVTERTARALDVRVRLTPRPE
jgi:acyl-CoA synthetase (NDP forming)/RimJ/RimL family protein N-acetyltransferase